MTINCMPAPWTKHFITDFPCVKLLTTNFLEEMAYPIVQIKKWKPPANVNDLSEIIQLRRHIRALWIQCSEASAMF